MYSNTEYLRISAKKVYCDANISSAVEQTKKNPIVAKSATAALRITIAKKVVMTQKTPISKQVKPKAINESIHSTQSGKRPNPKNKAVKWATVTIMEPYKSSVPSQVVISYAP